MPDLTYAPPVSPTDNLLQTVTLTVDNKPIGFARWHAPATNPDGVIQILDFHIAPTHRRQGHGKRLMLALISQAQTYHRQRNTPLRRAWAALRHKTHIIPRAFFAQQGFSHISTVKDLLTDEDLLIYVRTFN